MDDGLVADGSEGGGDDGRGTLIEKFTELWIHPAK